MYRLLFALSFISSLLSGQGAFEYFQLPQAVSLRGLDSYSSQVCWVSGSGGSVFRTNDGGEHWIDVSPASYDSLDFRDIQVFNEDAAIIVSAGFPTRILKTEDGGNSWKLVFVSNDKAMFLDAMDFWNSSEGMVFGDAIENNLVVLTTTDQGESWHRLDAVQLPDVNEGQGGFAASGTCLQCFGDSSVIIGLGGPEATILISEDRGQSWRKDRVPLSAGKTSAGIFSFSFLDEDLGICAGGDYTSDSASINSIALTRDAGKNWELIDNSEVNGYYHSSCLYFSEDIMIAMSRLGSSWSYDGGKTWERRSDAYYSISRFDGGFWCSGSDGRIARWMLTK